MSKLPPDEIDWDDISNKAFRQACEYHYKVYPEEDYWVAEVYEWHFLAVSERTSGGALTEARKLVAYCIEEGGGEQIPIPLGKNDFDEETKKEAKKWEEFYSESES